MKSVSKQGYTKGPWEIVVYNSAFNILTEIDENSEHSSIHIGEIQNITDAELIAKAPDMFEMLEKCRNYVQAYDDHHDCKDTRIILAEIDEILNIE